MNSSGFLNQPLLKTNKKRDFSTANSADQSQAASTNSDPSQTTPVSDGQQSQATSSSGPLFQAASMDQQLLKTNKKRDFATANSADQSQAASSSGALFQTASIDQQLLIAIKKKDYKAYPGLMVKASQEARNKALVLACQFGDDGYVIVSTLMHNESCLPDPNYNNQEALVNAIKKGVHANVRILVREGATVTEEHIALAKAVLESAKANGEKHLGFHYALEVLETQSPKLRKV